MTAIGDLRQRIEQVRLQNKESVPLAGEIEALEQKISNLNLSQAVIAEEQAVLKSLSFETRPVRHNSIQEAHQKTFGWVYRPGENTPTSATYVTKWLRSGDGLFWVSGKPGSGKSTFIKFLADDERTLDHLSEWSGTKRIIIASHYFWSAGNAMQKSQQGLLRTLLYEIFRQCSELIMPLCGNRCSGPDKQSASRLLSWDLTDLHAILREVAARDTVSARFCFFIDGLDEYYGDHYEICQVLNNLAKSPNIKICLSSRPWNVFEEAFGNELQRKVYTQDLTRNDILEYTRCRLSEHPRWSSLATGASGNWLVEEIEKRASGVFLWVFLVTRLLRESFTNRDSFSDIRRRLESFPLELEVFFRQILGSIEPFYHNKMSTTLQMTIAAQEPLHAMAYDFHDQEYDHEDYLIHLETRPYSAKEDSELREQTVWRLNSRSRGLLEMNRESGTVTFLHRTVMDFLKTPEMSDFLAHKAPSKFNLPLSLLKVYTAMIKRTQFKGRLIRDEFGRYQDCYLQFLTANALACVTEMEESHASNTTVYEILEELDRTLLVKFSQMQVKSISGRPTESFIREQLINGQHTGFLAWKLPGESSYLSKLGPSLIPRILTAKGGHMELDLNTTWRSRGVEMLHLILKTQDLDPNETLWSADLERTWTPWTVLISHTTSWSHRTAKMVEEQFWNLLENNIFSMLLCKGADPNAMLWRDVKCQSVFTAYLNLAFEVPSDTARERLYLQVLEDFFKAGAILETPSPGFMKRPIKRTSSWRSKTPSASDNFFGRLNTMHAAEPRGCNFRLLEEVVDILISTIGNSKVMRLTELVRLAVETKFPVEICERLRMKYPAFSWTQSSEGRKREAGTELEKDIVKALKAS
jgi:hypothetical protein